MPPVRLMRLQGIVCRTDLRVIGVPRSAVASPVSGPGAASSADRPPVARTGFIPSCLNLPFGVPSSILLAARAAARPAGGLSPPRGMTNSVHLPDGPCGFSGCARFPASRGSVLRLSQPLDGFGRHWHRGLVSSRSHVQGSSVQGLLPRRSLADSSPARASLSLSPGCSPASRLPHPCASTARLCSTSRCVPRKRGLASPAIAPLFGFPPRAVVPVAGPSDPRR